MKQLVADRSGFGKGLAWNLKKVRRLGVTKTAWMCVQCEATNEKYAFVIVPREEVVAA